MSWVKAEMDEMAIAAAIVNLTQHPATQDQGKEGVFNLEGEDLVRLKQLLTFEEMPNMDHVRGRAKIIAQIASDYGCERAMIGGAPFLMASLGEALKEEGITAVYAFSRRESVETTTEDGSVIKRNVFRHLGFVTDE